MAPFEQLVDGVGTSIPKTGPAARIRLACCDCGLVHDVAIVNGQKAFGLAVKRNKRATAARRKKLEAMG